MTPNEIKLTTLNGYLGTLIGEYELSIANSLREMEKFNITPKEFCKAFSSLNVTAFTLTYLKRAKKMTEETDYKTTENYIRFHKYQLETKVTDCSDVMLVAQNATISCLSTIIDLYLDK